MESFQNDTSEEVCSNDHTSNKPKKKKIRLPGICEMCGKTFKDKGQISIHMRIHTGERPYVCPVCNNTFNQRPHLKRHFRICHMGEKRFHCEYCDGRFTEKKSLQAHIRSHTGEKPFVCQFCGRRYTSRGKYKRHEQLHLKHEEFKGSFVCNTCNSKFDFPKHLERHMRIHDGNKKAFVCEVCKVAYSKRVYLNAHLKRDHNTVIAFQCDVCEQTFSSDFKLKMHYRLHELKKKSSHTTKEANADIPNVSNEEKTDTTDDSKIEDKSLVPRKGKQDNPTIQTTDIVLKQETINSSIHFKNRNNSLVLGEGDEQNKPSTHNKDITSQQILPVDQIPDHGCTKNRFLCGVCLKEFSNLTEIKEHLPIHTNHVKPFTCSICKEGFWSHLKLKLHVNSNHDRSEMLLECFLCEQTFSGKDEFKKHILMHANQENLQL